MKSTIVLLVSSMLVGLIPSEAAATSVRRPELEYIESVDLMVLVSNGLSRVARTLSERDIGLLEWDIKKEAGALFAEAGKTVAASFQLASVKIEVKVLGSDCPKEDRALALLVTTTLSEPVCIRREQPGSKEPFMPSGEAVTWSQTDILASRESTAAEDIRSASLKHIKKLIELMLLDDSSYEEWASVLAYRGLCFAPSEKDAPKEPAK